MPASSNHTLTITLTGNGAIPPTSRPPAMRCNWADICEWALSTATATAHRSPPGLPWPMKHIYTQGNLGPGVKDPET